MLTMDTKSPYVDYAYYTDQYHGRSIPEEEFENVELETEAYVNAITFQRVKRMDEVPVCVKNAICSASEAMYQYTEDKRNNVRSESNDGYSITYADAGSEDSCASQMYARVKRHLAGTGLTYRGWSEKYDY